MSKEKEINLGYILIDSDEFKAVGNLGNSLLYTEETCIAAMREAIRQAIAIAGDVGELKGTYHYVNGEIARVDGLGFEYEVTQLNKESQALVISVNKQSILNVMDKIK